MVKPKNAITKQYKELFKIDGVELEFDKNCVGAIAEKAIELKTGARGLRTILEDCMLNLMFLIPSDNTIKKVKISDKFIMGKSEAEIIRKSAEEVKAEKESVKNAEAKENKTQQNKTKENLVG